MRVTSGSSCAHGRVGPTSTSGSSRGVAASSATCLPGRDAQAADPQQVALGQPEALAHRGDLVLGPRVHHRVGRLGDHGDPLALEPEALDGVVGDGLGRHDHAHRALHGEVAQAQAQPPRRCSLRRLSAARSCSVTTIGQGLRSIAPSIQGEWKTSAPRRAVGLDDLVSRSSAVSRSACSRQRE